jgi:hypothetical protein
MDIMERFLNWSGGAIIGSLFIEWGLSRMQNRPFARKWFLSILIIAVGVKQIL